jgi:hypothetical protein
MYFVDDCAAKYGFDTKKIKGLSLLRSGDSSEVIFNFKKALRNLRL